MMLVLATISCGIWIVLLAGRSGFWRARETLDTPDAAAPPAASWPSVVAIVPARDEVEVIAASIGSLLRQRYPGNFSVVLVDDHSSDATIEVARAAAGAANMSERLTIISAPRLPRGWTGKLWALKQGIVHAERAAREPDFYWLSDADIAYAPDALAQLVSKARTRDLVLTSVMAKLNCVAFVERAIVPAFVFFFQMLYPFARVNDPASRTAAAAGGCMLARRDALESAGGIDAIRAELIDDCALARRLKRTGPIWLGFSDRVRSLRRYGTLDELRQMVARTAYCQLRYSPGLLALTLIALSMTFIAPAVLALFASGAAQGIALATWGLMGLAFQPTLKRYQVAPLWGLALPAIALVYLGFTVDSARQHGRARGGMWKGRAQAAQADVR